LLNWASARADGGTIDDAGWRAILAEAGAWRSPRFPLAGHDALAIGASGPAVGRLLRAVEEWWIEGDFQADRAACLARLRELAVHRDIESS
jgi:poly(A) polymerase